MWYSPGPGAAGGAPGAITSLRMLIVVPVMGPPAVYRPAAVTGPSASLLNSPAGTVAVQLCGLPTAPVSVAECTGVVAPFASVSVTETAVELLATPESVRSLVTLAALIVGCPLNMCAVSAAVTALAASAGQPTEPPGSAGLSPPTSASVDSTRKPESGLNAAGFVPSQMPRDSAPTAIATSCASSGGTPGTVDP